MQYCVVKNLKYFTKDKMNYKKMVFIATALKPINKKSHHVCFIFRKKRLLSIGVNDLKKTHPRTLKYNYTDRDGEKRSDKVTLHAEMAAIIKLGYDDCSDLTFYVIRIGFNNKVAYSKPCEGCLHLLKSVGYKAVYYSTDNNNLKKLKK